MTDDNDWVDADATEKSASTVVYGDKNKATADCTITQRKLTFRLTGDGVYVEITPTKGNIMNIIVTHEDFIEMVMHIFKKEE